MNETIRQCPQCKAALSANAPEGLCPQCLLKAAAMPPGVPGDMIDIGNPAEVAKALPQFEIIELLGQGGMGVVYKALQRALDRVVALKILPPADALSPDFIARFTREAQSLAKLSHPNIVGIYDFGESGGLYYFSMEFVDGVNLRALLAEKKVTAQQALAIVPCICDALAYAHDEGVVHRDIKPENILIDKKARVKIADFGLAKLLRRESLDLTLTATGVMLGTVRYMAPEQMDKPETVDHRADIYSLGVVFYEMLTGEVPMGRFAPPSATSGVDARLDEIVLHALEREPSARYQHATEVKTDIESIANLIEKLPPALRMHFGFDWRSERTLFGLPLMHVAIGLDPATGQQRTALGIVAIGGRARGVIAFGGMAQGLLAFGGIAMGGIAMGGVGLGIVSLSGLAVALFFSYGGVAIAPIAFGGMAVGYYAAGGSAFGVHSASATGGDGELRKLFRTWNSRLMIAFWGLFLTAMLAQFAGVWYAKRAAAASPTPPKPRGPGSSPARTGPDAPAELPKRHILGGVLALVSLVALFFGAGFRSEYSSMEKGGTQRTIIGALDPVFVNESHKSGFDWKLNFLSWSFLTLVIGGAAFAALLRITREDAGKIPRDAAWWRAFRQNLFFWGGLLLVVCIVRTALNPAAILKYNAITERR